MSTEVDDHLHNSDEVTSNERKRKSTPDEGSTNGIELKRAKLGNQEVDLTYPVSHTEILGQSQSSDTTSPCDLPSLLSSSSSTSSTNNCRAPGEPNKMSSALIALRAINPVRASVLLAPGWRDRWCKCLTCLPELNKTPYLLNEEESPNADTPNDPDNARSLLDLGIEALSQLPRERVIDGLHRYNTMRDGLMAFLKPVADRGEIVTKEHIQEFFELQCNR